MQYTKIQTLLAMALALLSTSTNGLTLTQATPNERSSSSTGQFAELDDSPVRVVHYPDYK